MLDRRETIMAVRQLTVSFYNIESISTYKNTKLIEF